MWPLPAFAGAAAALLIERLIGYPRPLQQAMGHPVQWIGSLIGRLDAALNRPGASPAEGRSRGAAAVVILLLASIVPAWAVASILSRFGGGWLVEALLATVFLAQSSLRQHVLAVHQGLARSLPEGRRAVSQIVGRDPAALDEAGVTRAALESLAENTSDGIVAPALWYALLGLPGLVAYKAINTADSMIGHKSERYLHFGWAAARLDDLVNLPFSRLAGLLFAAAAGFDRAPAIARTMWRDAPRHVSPNAGWPEAALAAALGIRLGGPRSYGGRVVDLAWMGDGRTALARDDIKAGLRLYGRALTLLFLLTALCGAVI